MIITKICPDCNCHEISQSNNCDRKGTNELTICCDECHKRRQDKLQKLEAMYPSAESLGLVGSTTEIPTERYRRPGHNGRRVMRKEERQGG